MLAYRKAWGNGLWKLPILACRKAWESLRERDMRRPMKTGLWKLHPAKENCPMKMASGYGPRHETGKKRPGNAYASQETAKNHLETDKLAMKRLSHAAH